jgi:simple sugar transport system permease protein
MLAEAARLPRLPDTRIHLGLALGLGLALLLALLLGKTKWGFEVRVIGRSAKAARYAGMALTRRTVAVMLLSGGVAGLAGMAEVSGIHYRLQQGVAAGYGYDGIIVACLARFNPLAAPLAAVALGSLFVGGEYLQSQLHMPSTISLVLEGVILLGFLGGEAIRANRTRRGSRASTPADEQDAGTAMGSGMGSDGSGS